MRRTTRGLLLAAVILGPSVLGAQEYQVDLDAENLVKFISRASIQKVEGVTDRIDGYVLLSSERLSATSVRSETEFYFEVDLASLDTGISLRNRHMRDNYLEVRDYPYVTLEGSISDVEAAPGGGFRVEGIGRMGIHGIEQVISIPCEVAEDGEGYHARCAFQVLLSDYEIKIPRVMFLKLANEIQIELDFRLKPAPTG